MHIDAILEVGVDCLCIETIPCQVRDSRHVKVNLISYPWFSGGIESNN